MHEPDHEPSPSVIAHYRITSKLCEGGMGAVYGARDTKLNRDVTIEGFCRAPSLPIPTTWRVFERGTGTPKSTWPY
jgi:hypothetical protein